MNKEKVDTKGLPTAFDYYSKKGQSRATETLAYYKTASESLDTVKQKSTYHRTNFQLRPGPGPEPRLAQGPRSGGTIRQ
jgi:hypothetical protein